MTEQPQNADPVDAAALRDEVKSKYREVASDPNGNFHFHTGRYLAHRLGYDDTFVRSRAFPRG
jgi:arsenite methyltransferase